jgi:hypothetical protein
VTLSFPASERRAAAAALFVVLLAGAPSPCAGQAAEPVALPEVKVGDRWTYRRMNYRMGRPAGVYEIRVVFAERGVIQVVGTGKGSDREIDTTYTAEWNAVSTRNRIFVPHTGWFRFPLRVGSVHEAVFDSRMPKKGDAHSRQQRTVRVLGWEDVVVPAGRFRALKIESAGQYQRLDKPVAGRARNLVWYVPEVKRWVKLELEITTDRGLVEHSGEELVRFALQ